MSMVRVLDVMPVRFADPVGFRVTVDSHERAVVDGRVGRERAGRQLAGLGGPLEDAGVRPGLGQRHRHLIAAGGGQLDRDGVGLIGQIAVGILDAQVDQVAWFDLRGRPADRFALVGIIALGLFARGNLTVKFSSSRSTILLLAMSKRASAAMRISASGSGTSRNSFLKSSGWYSG